MNINDAYEVTKPLYAQNRNDHLDALDAEQEAIDARNEAIAFYVERGAHKYIDCTTQDSQTELGDIYKFVFDMIGSLNGAKLNTIDMQNLGAKFYAHVMAGMIREHEKNG